MDGRGWHCAPRRAPRHTVHGLAVTVASVSEGDAVSGSIPVSWLWTQVGGAEGGAQFMLKHHQRSCVPYRDAPFQGLCFQPRR